jgi:hypothetical protein
MKKVIRTYFFRFAERVYGVSVRCLLAVLLYGCNASLPRFLENAAATAKEREMHELIRQCTSAYSAYGEAVLQRRFDAAQHQLALLKSLYSRLPDEQAERGRRGLEKIKSLEAALRNSMEKMKATEREYPKSESSKAETCTAGTS